MNKLRELKLILHKIITEDTNYEMRDLWIYQVLGLAAELRYPCGVHQEESWISIRIALPTGIISFNKLNDHFASSSNTTVERMKKFIYKSSQ